MLVFVYGLLEFDLDDDVVVFGWLGRSKIKN